MKQRRAASGMQRKRPTPGGHTWRGPPSRGVYYVWMARAGPTVFRARGTRPEGTARPEGVRGERPCAEAGAGVRGDN